MRVRDANSHNILSFSKIQLLTSRTRTFCISLLTSCFFASLCSRRSETAGFLLLCRSSGFVHFAGYYPAPSYPPFRAHINYLKTLQTRKNLRIFMRPPCIHLATLLLISHIRHLFLFLRPNFPFSIFHFQFSISPEGRRGMVLGRLSFWPS